MTLLRNTIRKSIIGGGTMILAAGGFIVGDSSSGGILAAFGTAAATVAPVALKVLGFNFKKALQNPDAFIVLFGACVGMGLGAAAVYDSQQPVAQRNLTSAGASFAPINRAAGNIPTFALTA